MQRLSVSKAVIVVSLVLTGCDNPWVFAQKQIEPGSAISLDASQRLVITSESGITCSEPPPDAAGEFARVFGASLSAKIGEQGADAEISDTVETTVSSLFERGQSVQVLRDAMYRVCEGASNGQLRDGEYRSLIGQLTLSLNYLVASEVCARNSDKLSKITSNRSSQGDEEITSGYELCITNAARFADEAYRRKY